MCLIEQDSTMWFTLTPVVTASLTLPLRGTREPLLNRVLIIIISNIAAVELLIDGCLVKAIYFTAVEPLFLGYQVL